MLNAAMFFVFFINFGKYLETQHNASFEAFNMLGHVAIYRLSLLKYTVCDKIGMSACGKGMTNKDVGSIFVAFKLVVKHTGRQYLANLYTSLFKYMTRHGKSLQTMTKHSAKT